MRHVMVLMSVLLGLLLVVSCADDGVEEYGGLKDSGAALAPEEKLSCTEAAECDDGNPCTLDECHEGFCDYQGHPIDEDLDGYVSHICGGPDCDDEDEMIHPGVIESPYDEEICFDGMDNDCNGLMDEADTGCFHCDTAEDCDDGNPCVRQACVEGRCAYTYNVGPCDDGYACTVNDTCFGGICIGDPLDADQDGYVDEGCGGDDCDDSLPGVHPGAQEGPAADPSCEDGSDNDCDSLTDAAELACQRENKVIELTAEEQLAPTWTDLEIALTVGTFQENEVVRISYVGEVEAVYVTTEDRVWVEDMSLTGDPVSTSILIPLGTLNVELDTFRVASKDPENLILDPEGYFSANIRLRIDTIASVSLNILPIVQDYPISLFSEDMSVSGQWMPRGDTDGDGREEFDLLVAGTLTYEFAAMDIPLLGEVAATMSGDVELGFRGEAL